MAMIDKQVRANFDLYLMELAKRLLDETGWKDPNIFKTVPQRFRRDKASYYGGKTRKVRFI